VLATQSFSPSEEIVNTAKKYGCDAIFMSSHGRKGLSKLFVASETQKVLAHSTVPVLVLR
jgi:nucleotide-binding universal stress UspA family protein